ncbi:MAG: hypothetical protein GY896_22965 [Gammaproteobacteria bacterium]|nr:hypothetical protein [Gammaproteobacteria bacterium]
MRIFFESKNKSYFPVWKITLLPGENVIPDDIGGELLKAHQSDCERGGKKDKARLWKLAEPAAKPITKPKPPIPAFAKADKKGAK